MQASKMRVVAGGRQKRTFLLGLCFFVCLFASVLVCKNSMLSNPNLKKYLFCILLTFIGKTIGIQLSHVTYQSLKIVRDKLCCSFNKTVCSCE